MKNILVFLLLITSQILLAQTVEIKITNIKNKNGSFQLAVYKDAASYENKTPLLKNKYLKTNVNTNGELMVILNLAEGTYGIALLDDENGNTKMDYNFLGMPKEGFGFSDFYLTGISKPTFTDFDFLLKNETKNITIKIRYL